MNRYSTEEAVLSVPSVHKLLLEKIQLQLRREIAKFPSLVGMDVDIYTDVVSDNIVAHVRATILAGKIDSAVEYVEVTYPTGVWQTFKDKFMPKWFVRRFPVRTVSQIIPKVTKNYFMCPHTYTDDRRVHIAFMGVGQLPSVSP